MQLTVERHILDDNDAVARLDPPQLFGVSPQRQNALNPDPFARSGVIGPDQTGELPLEGNQPTALVLEWSVK